MKKTISLILSLVLLFLNLSQITSLADNECVFGDTYTVIKDFDRTSLSETEILSSGYSASTSSSNYNNVVLRSKSSANSGYYPYGSGLPDNGFYLFFGSGGNSNVSVTLSFPQTVAKEKYIKITYAKPYATNNGSTNRNADNSADVKMTIGSEVLNLKENCEFDKWYTSVIRATSDISKLDILLGKWGALAISNIEILDSANMLELSADAYEKYITPNIATVQCTGVVYNCITTLKDSDEVLTKGSINSDADVAFSIDTYDGVAIDDNGLLTILPSALAGTVTVNAAYSNATKSITIELLEASDADKVSIVGDELVKKGASYNFSAIPSIEGAIIPERDTLWTIVGDNNGCSIENGVLTVPENAQSGNIEIKATLDISTSQTTAGISDTLTVTIKDESDFSPYSINSVFFKNCIPSLEEANGIDGISLKATAEADGYRVVIKAVNESGITVLAYTSPLININKGVQEVKTPMEFKNAKSVKAYIVNSDNEIVSDEIFKTDTTAYKNVPVVSDWITGEKSGLGMGKGIMSPTGAPYGVNPSLVDVTSSINYTYDSDYTSPSSDNILWYKTAAYNSSSHSIYARDGRDWEEQALPIGNGYMAGMLFGNPNKDQIQINEETFWAAGYRGTQTAVSADTVNKNMSEGINGYMSVGNIFVDFHDIPDNATIKNYYRDLNLDESVSHVKYNYNNINYAREYFATYPKEVLVLRYTADSNALNFTVNPVSMHPGDVTVSDGEITITGKLKDSEPYSSGGNAAWNQESDLEYCTKIKVIPDDGTMVDGYNSVDIQTASGVTILIAAATDYDKDAFTLNSDGSVNMDKTPYKSEKGIAAAIEKATRRINNAATITYDELKAEHIADYKSQFDTVKFSLTDDTEICNVPTNELQSTYSNTISTVTNSDGTTSVSYDNTAYTGLNKHLEELHFNYARYLMISSSRSDTMPANLQGKWCQSTAEIWGSCYCININMEMNYWFAGGANLADSTKSLIGWFNSQIPAGRVTAKNYYKVTPKSYTYEDGKILFTESTDDKDDVFIMHTKQSIMGTTDLTGSTNIQSPGNTAWLMYNLWDLYKTTGDKELLANEIYPIMRKVANFYTQYLYTNMKKTTDDSERYPDGYYYTTWRGRSPEHGPTQEGQKYDLQLVASMYDYTIEAANVLGIDTDKISAWEEIRNHLEIPVELGLDGQIKEWSQETNYNTDSSGNALGDPVHRHISHLVALYPGNLINRNTPELLEGAKTVLKNRGDDSTGWSCSNKFLLWARALDGNKALELLRYQLAKKTYANLFDTHSPFQIDGNFGSAAGIMELLMQSHTGITYILPALPDVWDKGEISGIKTKDASEISIKWKDNKATEFSITPQADGDITIGYELSNSTFIMNNTYIDFGDDMLYTIKNAKKGITYTFISSDSDERSISVSNNAVIATGFEEDSLIVAGYSENGVMQKVNIYDTWSAPVSDFDGCYKIEAFLWDDIKTMKPLCKSYEFILE